MPLFSQPDTACLESCLTQTGQSLAQLSVEKPLLLVFLRHFGCAFCRQAVSDLARQRSNIESAGTRIAFVHLGTEERAAKFFQPYGLDDLPRYSNESGSLYQSFGLDRINWRTLFQRINVYRTLWAWLEGSTTGKVEGDIYRMPGAFLLKGNKIIRAFRHKEVSDRPDYLALSTP